MMFTRLKYLFGEEKLAKLKKAKVAVVGLGGVGGICAIALVRSGIENIILCDFDKVDITNINRQVVAYCDTIGMYKTDVLEKMINRINPNCKVTKITNKVNKDLLLYQPQYVIDAIDDIKSKIELIKLCLENKITFISSMGAAKKTDISKIAIMKLSKTTYDPIAKILRHEFKNNDFFVVSSTESTKSIELGSYMPVVSTFGLYMCDYIIKQIMENNA